MQLRPLVHQLLLLLNHAITARDLYASTHAEKVCLYVLHMSLTCLLPEDLRINALSSLKSIKYADMPDIKNLHSPQTLTSYDSSSNFSSNFQAKHSLLGTNIFLSSTKKISSFSTICSLTIYKQSLSKQTQRSAASARLVKFEPQNFGSVRAAAAHRQTHLLRRVGHPLLAFVLVLHRLRNQHRLACGALSLLTVLERLQPLQDGVEVLARRLFHLIFFMPAFCRISDTRQN